MEKKQACAGRACYAKCWCLKVLKWLQGGKRNESPRKSHLIPKCILWWERESERMWATDDVNLLGRHRHRQQQQGKLPHHLKKDEWMCEHRCLNNRHVSQLTSVCVCVYDVVSFPFKCFYSYRCAHWLPGGPQTSWQSHVVVAAAGNTTYVFSGAKWIKRHNSGVTSM